MANKTAVAAAVNLLYGAHGRQVHDAILHAYHRALAEVNDYQLERATDYLMRHHRNDFPPTAAETLAQAAKYRRSAEADAAHIEHNREQLRIAAKPKQITRHEAKPPATQTAPGQPVQHPAAKVQADAT